MAAIIKNIVDFTGRLSMGMSKATALKTHNVVIQLMSATMKSFSFSIHFFMVNNLKSQKNPLFSDINYKKYNSVVF